MQSLQFRKFSSPVHQAYDSDCGVSVSQTLPSGHNYEP
jgi:hypothetical protein